VRCALLSLIIPYRLTSLLLSSFYGLPQFAEKYGVLQPDGTFSIPAPWKSGLSDGQQVGEIIGLAICGLISERLGYRRTMLGALGLITGLIFILFFAPNVKVLLVGEILCGIPWGYAIFIFI
jgi:SP family general alpha glucoside:H+ symporter-like MFS transporter